MIDTKRATILPVHRQEAGALKALWDGCKHRRSQAEFGLHYDLGNQSNVGSYLLARSALNIKAALAFAAELRCDVAAFSTRLAADIRRLGVASPGPEIANRDTREEQLLRSFRRLPIRHQDLVLAMMGGASKLEKTKVAELEEVAAAKARVIDALSSELAASFFGSSCGAAELAAAVKKGLGGFDEMTHEQLVQCAIDSGAASLLYEEIELLGFSSGAADERARPVERA